MHSIIKDEGESAQINRVEIYCALNENKILIVDDQQLNINALLIMLEF